ncbi:MULTISPECIES: hypothetical protein [unclassified Gemella]|uniref:Nmad4 family putative nucleotide modification protein n=1 Tax=unclassified Gemella TaxID=2624949 RepID=UPI0010732FE3|nr:MULTISPECIES: hypothetical protein [unclassified Gemella]MBF0710473.1 hypothetical protein [Gemella sp. GL1.1]MBF0746585.1 hypothetical protein [Gemella sp. 19428wG2_WT2a]NYS27817.1 hypothetical protein [Gemella sp. GL1]TFU59943.1 hypothetical protein E4T67_02845 [Gemella sp. WT2a]
MKNFQITTTLENLQDRYNPLDSSIVFKNYVIVTKEYWKERGCFVAIYEFQDIRKSTNILEKDLVLVEENEELFEDSGSAVAWAFTKI